MHVHTVISNRVADFCRRAR